MSAVLEKEKEVIKKVLGLTNLNKLINASTTLSKDSHLSEEARLTGNKLFIQKNHNSEIHEKILHKYAQSIAFAPPSSEALALGYGNRSALLLRLSKFAESIKDIDRALSITKSNLLKTKLLCRKVKCLRALDSTADIKNILQKARHFHDKIENSKKEDLLKVLKEAENYLNKQSCAEASLQKHQIKTKEDNKIPQILKVEMDVNNFSSVSIEHNKKFGNHVIAKKDISPGEAIFIEKPYVFAVNQEKNYLYCSHCFTLSWATIPCNSCWRNMYCSEECKNEAWNMYHDHECATFINCDVARFADFDKFILVTMRALILGVKEAGSIEKLKNELEKLEKHKGKIL